LVTRWVSIVSFILITFSSFPIHGIYPVAMRLFAANFWMQDAGCRMQDQGGLLTAKRRESGSAAREILQSSLPSSRSLMNDSEWVVKEDYYHPLAALARGREDGDL
jgi:hypothetical protein